VIFVRLLTGCGKSLPKTKANLDLCAVLAKVRDNQAPIVALAGATFETNAQITPQLRQEVGQYVVDVHENAQNAPQDAMKAETDCASIGAPVAKGY